MSPERPMRSAFSSRAVSRIRGRRDHDPEVDDLVVVALEDDADDVLADIVDVALDRGHHDQAVVLRCGRVLLGLDERHEVSHGLLHDPGALDDLGQEHLAGAEEVADDVHPVHQRALDDMDRPLGGLPRLLRVLDDPVVDPLDEGVDEPVVDRSAPATIGRPGGGRRRRNRRSGRPARSGARSRRGAGRARRPRHAPEAPGRDRRRWRAGRRSRCPCPCPRRWRGTGRPSGSLRARGRCRGS